MASKQKIIITGTILTIITLIIYLFFRVDVIEKDYVKSINKSSIQIFNTYRVFDEKPGIEMNRSKELEKLVYTINNKVNALSLIVISKLDYNIQIIGKGSKSIKNQVYEKILYEFTNGKISIPSSSDYIIRYYDNESQNKMDEYRFYLFSKIINKSRVFLAYKYNVNTKSIIKVAAESGLIILFFIILSSLLYLISLKSKNFSRSENMELFESSSNVNIDQIKTEKTLHSLKQTAASSTKNTALDAMNTYVYELFIDISRKFKPESLALFTKLSHNIFTKSHELKENSFKVIESKTFDTFNLNDDVFRELAKSRIMVMDGGQKSIIPVINDTSLLGFIQLVRSDNLRKNEISEIKNDLGTIADYLAEYLVINNIMIDRNTGLFSETYFRLKYNELMQLNKSHGNNFSVIMISIFHRKGELDESDKPSVIKTLAPVINKIIPAGAHTCLYKEHLSIILPGIDVNHVTIISEEIRISMSKYRIKLKSGEVFKTEPVVTFSSTGSAREAVSPVESAETLLKGLLFGKNSSMQTSII